MFTNDTDLLNFYNEHYDELFHKSMKTIKSRFPDVYDYVTKRFSDYRGNEVFSELLYRIQHKLEEIPKCIICGNPIQYKTSKGRYDKHFCSKACERTKEGKALVQKIIEKTKENRYGNPYYNNHEKYINTLLDRYGVDSPLKVKEIEQKAREKRTATIQEKYGVDHTWKVPEILQKTKQTLIERYGVDNIFKSAEKREEIRNTWRQKYGYDNPNKNKIVKQKAAETCIKKYGVDNPMKVKEIKQKAINTCIQRYGVDNPMKVKEIKQKAAKTCIYKYGVDNPMKNEHILKHSFITRFKVSQTGTSKVEQRIFNIIKEMFDENCQQQYISDLYPYHCDYYLPKYDLYIELNGLWTHNDHPYDPKNKNDKKILEQWQKKAEKSLYYENAIHIWTEADPQKLKTAEDNKLKYLVIYSCDDNIIINKIKKYINNIC